MGRSGSEENCSIWFAKFDNVFTVVVLNKTIMTSLEGDLDMALASQQLSHRLLVYKYTTGRERSQGTVTSTNS